MSINKLLKLSQKFDIILKKYAGSSDYTALAREALGLNGKKYPANHSGEATLADGIKVRLLPSTQQGNMSSHRLQMECPYCKEWLPTGRYHQHKIPCRLKNDPTIFQDVDALITINTSKYHSSKNYKERSDLAFIIADLYEEKARKTNLNNYDEQESYKFNSDMNKQKKWFLNAYTDLARHIAEEKFGKNATILNENQLPLSVNLAVNKLSFPLSFIAVYKGFASVPERLGIIEINQDGSYKINTQ